MCLHCSGIHEQRPIFHVLACDACRVVWCEACTGPEKSCPTCRGSALRSLTLVDDAYL